MGRFYSAAAGGLVFWFPAIALTSISREGVSTLWSNIVSMFGLVGLLMLDWIYCRSAIRLNWALAGVYMLGPFSTIVIAWFTGVAPPWKAGGWLFDAVICLLPPITLWLSLLSGQIFSVLAVTIGLPFLEIWRRRRRAHTEAQPQATV